MDFVTAANNCHVRASISRRSNPEKRYPKNHFYTLFERVPVEDQRATDWQEYDHEVTETSIIA